jgi:hypothetical protein
MLVAIRPEKEFGKCFIRFTAKDYSSSRGYLPSRSAKRLLQAEGTRRLTKLSRKADFGSKTNKESDILCGLAWWPMFFSPLRLWQQE